MRDLVSMDPFKKKKPWSWLTSDDFFSVPLPSEFKKMDFRQPAISVSDVGKNIKISAELPGIDKKGLNVSLSDHSVSISAKQTAKSSLLGKNKSV